MPYTGQHAFRLLDPKTMDANSFRTTHGGTLYGGKVKVPITVNVIWAKPKNKSEASDPIIVQSLRFPTDNGWTVQKVQAWLKDNSLDSKGKLEPASKEKEVTKSSEQTKEEDNSDEQMYMNILEVFIDEPVNESSREIDTPKKAMEALAMDDVELGAYVKELIKKAMARKRLSIEAYDDSE